MPSVYTSQQKTKIQQLCSVTQVPERTAAKFLKSNDWKVEQAANAFFQASGGSGGSSASGQTAALNKLFDSYRDDPEENPDIIGVEGAMRYLKDIKVQLDEIAVLAIGEALQAPTMGEFTRDGFVKGWRTLNSDTLTKQQSAASRLRTQLPTDQDLFRRVYRYTFQLARLPGQKAVALDAAIEYWRLLFTPPHGVAWSTPSGTPWLDRWITYLTERWKRTVNRDMWNMTYEFFRKSIEQDDLSWWDEQGAWPGVLDDFVGYVKETREKEGGEPGAMEVE
ncbi:MAG: Scaffold-type E3 ligase [Sclerophora amabilis]|nr:MAG: Scaffold-type E3 ligase [Sclerophora amabilis]